MNTTQRDRTEQCCGDPFINVDVASRAKRIMLTTDPSSSMLGWTKWFGSGMFIPDPGSVFFMPEPGSRVAKIPYLGSGSA
jgi:hypothetical protein